MTDPNLNARVWKANMLAIKQVAGMTGFDSEYSAFYVSTGNLVGLPGTILGLDDHPNQDSASTTVKGGADAAFNDAVLKIVNVLPSPKTPHYSPSGNKRVDNILTFLGLVDVGAPNNRQAYDLYMSSKKDLDTKENQLITELTTAMEIYQTAYPTVKESNPNFWDWLAATYVKRLQIKKLQRDLVPLQSRVNDLMQKAMGPYGQALARFEAEVKRASEAGPPDAASGQYKMLCQNSWEPYYSVGSVAYNKMYTSWMSNETAPVTTELKITEADSLDYSSFGLDEAKFEGAAAFEFEPFLFFGEADAVTTETKTMLYRQQTYKSVSVSLTLLGQPGILNVSSGDWAASDPGTVFPKLLANTDKAHAYSLLYPFITQIVVGYGMGYKLKLDDSTYANLKQVHTENKKGSVIGVLDFIFEGGASAESSLTTSYSNITFLDNSNEVVIAAPQNEVGSILGVVVSRKPSDSQKFGLDGRLEDFIPFVYEGEGDTAAQSATLIGDLTQLIASMPDTRREAMKKQMLRLFTSNNPQAAFESLQRLLTKSHSWSKAVGHAQVADKLSFTQTWKDSSISITVETCINRDNSDEDDQETESDPSFSPEAYAYLHKVIQNLDDYTAAVRQRDGAIILNTALDMQKLLAPVAGAFAGKASKPSTSSITSFQYLGRFLKEVNTAFPQDITRLTIVGTMDLNIGLGWSLVSNIKRVPLLSEGIYSINMYSLPTPRAFVPPAGVIVSTQKVQWAFVPAPGAQPAWVDLPCQPVYLGTTSFVNGSTLRDILLRITLSGRHTQMDDNIEYGYKVRRVASLGGAPEDPDDGDIYFTRT